ncbi:MAG: hypothetical protein WDZ59_11905 [Pirellulales bacterium]
MTSSVNRQTPIDRWQKRAIVAGVVGVIVCAIAAALDLEMFYRAYLIGFLFWWTAAIGCLGLVMLHHLVGGTWGRATRPIFESGAETMLLVAVLFVPVGLGVAYLYPWARPEEVAADPLLQMKSQYLNVPFMLGRAAAFFIVWLVLAVAVIRMAARARRLEKSARRRRVPRLSAGGLVLLVLTASFAAIDWAMSLDPHWYSTIYGILVAIGGAVAALSLAILSITAFAPQAVRDAETFGQVLHDLGNLLLAFLMLWTYFGFSQFLIIYSGNIPEEAIFYVHRLEHGWQWLALAIVVLAFATPFAMLLSRDNKRDPARLAGIAALVFVMQWVHLIWLIGPSLHHEGMIVPWAEAGIFVGVGGFWLAVAMSRLRKRIAAGEGELLLNEPIAGVGVEHG